MNPLQRLASIDATHWPALRHRAIAAGCGRVLHPDDERLAGPDELLALAVPELVRAGVLALIAGGTEEPPDECASALSANAAAVLRLLDHALAVHGRDTGYAIDAWLVHVFEWAQTRAQVVARMEADELPLGILVEASAEAAAEVVIALHRDRLGVPEGLADALSSLLVLYAAGSGTDG